jgi:cytochrome b involved in lipid metabolism
MIAPMLNHTTNQMPFHCAKHHEEGSLTSTCCSTASVTSSMTPSLATTGDSPELIFEKCDACPSCPDVCCSGYEEHCVTCSEKILHFKQLHDSGQYNRERHQHHNHPFSFLPSEPTPSPQTQNSPSHKKHSSVNKKNTDLLPITRCQLKRHNNPIHGIWLLCGNDVYDATNYIKYHPGGEKSILRKSGGVIDCTKDMSFHSPRAIKAWKKLKIGYLVPCPSEECISQESNVNGNFIKRSNSEFDFLMDKKDQCVIC